MKMEKLFLLIVLCVASSFGRTHYKFSKSLESYDSLFNKVPCTRDHEGIRKEIIRKAQCGEPKEVFVPLENKKSYEEVRPSAVWVKRCVGLCDFDGFGSKCVPLEAIIRHIPVRIYNVNTDKESCATYEIEEHINCGCCAQAPDDCPAPKVFVPRKCACQCPNLKERRECLSKKTHMRWNRSSCKCEPRRKPRSR